MSLKKCPACGEYFADTYKRCPFCEEEVNPRKVKKPKRNEGGRRLSRREYEEELPTPIYDDGPHRGAAKHGSQEESTYKGRRSREEAYDEETYEDGYREEEDYRPRRSVSKGGSRYDERAYKGRRTREEEYDEDGYEDDYDDGYEDDYYDEDDDDRGSPWFKIVLVILCAIIIACVLYLARGPIGNLLQLNDHQDDHQQQSSMISDDEPEPPQNPDDITPIVPEVDDPNEENDPQNPSNQGNGNTTDPQQPDVSNPSQQPDTPDTPNTVTQPLALSHEDVTISGGESFVLSVQGSRDSVTYTVKDAAIAKVSSSGTVTGLKKGVTEVIVQRGGEKAKCIVRVSSTAAQEGGGTTPSTPTDAKLSLSKDDFTLKVGESYTITTPGISDGVTWSVSDSSVATVSGGKVSAVAKGTTTVTATWNGQKAKCIVRVK